jgi:hypothetical protein
MKNKLFLRLVCLVVILAASLSALSAADAPSSTSAKTSDPWQPLRVLIGKWKGDSQGQPGTGKSEREYHFTLNNRFIQVTNRSVYPPKANNPKGETHEDIGFFSYDKTAKKLVLRQFHTEGFVNQYVLDSVSADGRTIVFVTTAIENIPAGWRGRETYRVVSDDEFVETFALAEPGKDFVTYTETHFRRQK